MALAVTARPMQLAITVWCVRRLCSRVLDHMARGAMTLAEPHVQPAMYDPTQGDECFDLASNGSVISPRTLSHTHGRQGRGQGSGSNNEKTVYR